MKPLRRAFALLATLALSALCHAQPAFVAPELDGPRPWTDKPFAAETRAFQFVIVTDRTGGMRPGVFAEAVGDINLLRPEFVISVGDLIDGYTRNRALVDRQWNEFERIVDRLEMPFFRVPGNHDITNPVMAAEWRERFGPSWYHFLYHDVLFLCLDTQDPPPTGIGKDQAAYFRRVLDANPDPRHTIVFMHRPLWSYGDKAGYERIEAMLKGREYTLFSGHHHHYLKVDRNGNRHFILATTGGGSRMRGPQVGEFDHITWVTMLDGGPRIAHLDVEGIRGEDLVVQKSRDEVDSLRNAGWFAIDPVVHTSDVLDELHASIRFRNPADSDLTIAGKLSTPAGVRIEPASVDLLLGEDESLDFPIVLSSKARTPIDALPPIRFELTGSYPSDEWGTIALPARQRLVLDWTRTLAPAGDTPGWIDVADPGYVKEDWDWKGADDGLLRFALSIGPEALVLDIEAKDDAPIHPDSNDIERVDKFLVALDARPADARSANSDSPRQRGEKWLYLEIAPRPKLDPVVPEKFLLPEGTATDASVSGETMTARLEIPLAWIAASGGEDWDGVRLNVGWMDHDNPDNTKPSVIWWKPPWHLGESYPNSGAFSKRP